MNEIAKAIFGNTIRTRILIKLYRYNNVRTIDLYSCASGFASNIYRELRILKKTNLIFIKKRGARNVSNVVSLNPLHTLYKPLKAILCYNDINDENRSQQSN